MSESFHKLKNIFSSSTKEEEEFDHEEEAQDDDSSGDKSFLTESVKTVSVES